MDEKAILTTLLHGNQLKRTTRTGWTQRGVANAESVAAHSFGVCFTTLILASEVAEAIDLKKALAMAVLHDLPEALTTDIPTTAWQYMPEGSKLVAEEKAVQRIFEKFDEDSKFMALWHEMRDDLSNESRLVHDADKIDLFIQALVYERQSSNLYLEEFWSKEPIFHFKESKALYETIRSSRLSAD